MRAWDCPVCGHHHDSDVNAARNILAKAKEIISA
ncbi:MAG: transposase [Selenomonadaceae bacterium]|nr:transposase [Selenomonadaceae bacterium]